MVTTPPCQKNLQTQLLSRFPISACLPSARPVTVAILGHVHKLQCSRSPLVVLQSQVLLRPDITSCCSQVARTRLCKPYNPPTRENSSSQTQGPAPPRETDEWLGSLLLLVVLGALGPEVSRSWTSLCSAAGCSPFFGGGLRKTVRPLWSCRH